MQVCQPLQCCNLESLTLFFGKLPVPLTAFFNRLNIQCFLRLVQHTLGDTHRLRFFQQCLLGYIALERYSSIKFSACSDFFSLGIPLSKSSTIYHNDRASEIRFPCPVRRQFASPSGAREDLSCTITLTCGLSLILPTIRTLLAEA